MSELLLDSLEIKGYRCFEHLTIEKLGRVNLIVGKNGVGKTSLVEALWIYAQRGRNLSIKNCLVVREELPISSEWESGKDKLPDLDKLVVLDVTPLFFGHPALNKNLTPIFIGPINNFEDTVKITVEFLDPKVNSPLDPKLKVFKDAVPSLIVEKGNEAFVEQRIYDCLRVQPPSLEFVLMEPRRLRCYFIHSRGINGETVVSLWEQIALKEPRDFVISALKIIDSEIEQLDFITNPVFDGKRVPFVRVRSSSEPMPLRARGEGVSRLLNFVLALVNCKDGMLLIDEIENGIHYSVLPDVWRLIFKTARELNVQVFATTHSSDCIYAFQKAAEEDEGEGMLIRLVNRDNKIHAITFDEEELETVAQRNIEVR